MNARTTTENVRRCALIHMTPTTVRVVTAIDWHQMTISVQVCEVDFRGIMYVQFLP